jgi:hypothetical protein
MVPTGTTRPATATTTTPQVAKLINPDGEDDHHVDAHATTGQEQQMLSARLTGGIAKIGAGALTVPVQPVFGVAGGYPLPLGPITLDVGAGLSYTPLPYQVSGMQERGTMLGLRAVGSARYPVAPQITVRGELGLGVVMLGGLVDGNPLSTTRASASYTLPNVRVGAAADYAITPNILATVSPAFGYSPGASGMYASSLTELDLVVGVGYVR